MRNFKYLALLLVVGMGLLLLGFYIFQSALLFHPQVVDAHNEKILSQRKDVESLEIPRASNARLGYLRGWLVHSTGGKPANQVVIYFGGNADEASWMALQPQLPREVSWVFINYVGYGKSDDAPSEQTLFADALLSYDYLVKSKRFEPKQILLMGRSLGTGAAVYLASQRAVNRLLLITPYDSITAVAQAHFPWLPVQWLLKHPFDSLKRATTLRNAVVILAASNDRTIPPVHTQRLHAAWLGPKQWRLIESDHNSILSQPETWHAISQFVVQEGIQEKHL